MKFHQTTLKLAASAAVLLLASGASQAVNLINNGSFEIVNPLAGVAAPSVNNYYSLTSTAPKKDWILGWEVFNDTLAWIGGPLQGLTAQDQTRFLDLTDTQLSNPFGGIRQSVNLAANTNYDLKFWLGTSTTFNGQTTVQVAVGAGAAIALASAPAAGANTWVQRTLTFNSGVGGATNIALLGWLGQDYIGIDNVTLEASPVPEPSSVAMLFAGLAAVGSVVARRRKSI